MARDPSKLPSVDLPGFASAQQVADLLGVSRHYVRRLGELGVLLPRALLHGELPVFSIEEVKQYRARHPRIGKLLRAKAVTKPQPPL